jgi:hypothetical protein
MILGEAGAGAGCEPCSQPPARHKLFQMLAAQTGMPAPREQTIPNRASAVV